MKSITREYKGLKIILSVIYNTIIADLSCGLCRKNKVVNNSCVLVLTVDNGWEKPEQKIRKRLINKLKNIFVRNKSVLVWTLRSLNKGCHFLIYLWREVSTMQSWNRCQMRYQLLYPIGLMAIVKILWLDEQCLLMSEERESDIIKYYE